MKTLPAALRLCHSPRPGPVPPFLKATCSDFCSIPFLHFLSPKKKPSVLSSFYIFRVPLDLQVFPSLFSFTCVLKSGGCLTSVPLPSALCPLPRPGTAPRATLTSRPAHSAGNHKRLWCRVGSCYLQGIDWFGRQNRGSLVLSGCFHLFKIKKNFFLSFWPTSLDRVFLGSCGVDGQLQLRFDPSPGNLHMPHVWT